MAVFGRDIMALLKGEDGSALQIRVSDGYIQWKLETDTEWNNVIAVDDLKGADGSPVELRLYSGWIEWKLQSEDDTQWKNLVAVSTLQGKDGEDGEDGKDGLSVKTAELSSELQVPSAAAFDAVTVGTTGEINPTNISDFVVGDIIVIPCTISGMTNGNAVMLGEVKSVGSSNITYSVVAAIRNGEDGNALQIRVSDGYIQYKLETDTEWNNVIAVDELKGDDGATPTMNQFGMWFINGESTGVSGRGTRMVVAETESPVTMTKAEFEALVVGGSYTIPLIINEGADETQSDDLIYIPTTISDMSGGGAFQIGILGGFTSGGEKRSYTLVSAIMVEDGEDGSALEIRVSDGYIQWKLATQTAWKNVIAVDELKGADGVTPHIGEDGYWYLGDTSTGVKAQGTNGTDGTDGVGVPAGGTTGQVLKKKSNTDYDTEWSDEEGGGGAATEVTKSAIANALGCTESQLDTLVALAQKVTVSGSDVKFATGTVLKSSYFDAVD